MTNLTILSKSIRQLDDLYSLNDLHKTSGADKKHQPANFMRIEQTQELVKEIERSSNMRNAFKVSQGGKAQGTYVCKELVYAYAMWISPKFNLAVIRAFDVMQQPIPQIEHQEPTLTSDQRQHIREQVGILVHADETNSFPKQYGKLQNKFRKNSYKDILAKDYPAVCEYLGCKPFLPAVIQTETPEEKPTYHDADKYQLINKMIEQMGLKDKPTVVPYLELEKLVNRSRDIEKATLNLLRACGGIDDAIGNLKDATGKSLFD